MWFFYWGLDRCSGWIILKGFIPTPPFLLSIHCHCELSHETELYQTLNRIMQIIILIAIYRLAKFANTILQKLSILLQRLKNYMWVLRTLIWLVSLKMQIMAPEIKTERKLRLLGVSNWLYHCCFFHMLYSEIQNSMSVSTKCRLNTKPTGIVTQLLFRGHLPGSLNSWRNVLGLFSRKN